MEGKERVSNPLVFLLRMTWRFSEGNRNNIVIFWSLFMIARSLELFCQPLIAARMMEVIQKVGITPESIKTLWGLLGLMVLTEAVFWMFHGPARLLECANAFIVRKNYRFFLLNGVLTMPVEWHVKHHSGDTIDKIEKGTNSLYDFSAGTFEIIYSGVNLMVSCFMLGYFSPFALSIAIVVMAINVAITMRFDKVLVVQYRKLSKSENSIAESVNDMICNIRTVIILRVEQLIFKTIMRKVEEPFSLFKRNNYLNEWKWFSTSQFCQVMIALSLGIYFFQHSGAKGGVLVSSVYLLVSYLNKLGDLFFHFAYMYGDILKRAARVANAEELSQDFQPVKNTEHVLPKHWRQLSIEGLNFSYSTDGGKRIHLDDVDLTVDNGEKIAVVGPSGGGKSTLLSVLRGILQAASVTLKVDGYEIPQGFDGISRAVSFMPQLSQIFATTILGNITMEDTKYSEEMVQYYSDMACFTEVIPNLPNGFDSSTTEDGVDLSGGQRQRLALARALARCDGDIVALDEPTSDLDAENSMKVYQNIFREFKDKTVISSIHQLHLLPLFDRVIVVDEGKIVGQGTIDQLLVHCVQFQELWKKSNVQHKIKEIVK